MDLVSQVSVQIMDFLPQPSDVILDTTPNFRGGTAGRFFSAVSMADTCRRRESRADSA